MAANHDRTEPYLREIPGAAHAATVALTPPESGSGPRSGAPPRPRTGEADPGMTRVAMVEGSGPHLSIETDALRQRRLRAAAGFLIVSLAVFLAWRLVFSQTDLWPLNVAVISGIGAAMVLLYDPRAIPPRRLRAIEFAIFGLMVLYLAVRQYHAMVTGPRDGSHLLAATRGSILGVVLLMFNYTVFIPNTWRDASKVILVFAVVPIVTKAVVLVTHPAIFRAMHDASSAAMISENIAFMAVASALAIYGAHVLNVLRTEAFEARQLNQYRLVAPIGSGGMGDVYLAEHRLMKRPCALKLIRPERANDPRSVARFEREVRATARLSHPNTVEIFDYGRTEDGTFYYVMEYLPGMSLEEIVAKHGPMPPGRAVYLLRQACGALGEAHASGLIHRDLKPANIFAAKRGGRHDVAKLLDFGLVKDLCDAEGNPDLAREHTVQGTPLYMAPEQVQGRPDLDHRIDLYALGCIAYTLLTGRPPFERETRVGVMTAHAHEPVVPPSHLREDIPDDLERVILRCLAKDPAARYPDAEALEAALASCASAADWDARVADRWWRENEPAWGHERSRHEHEPACSA